jgi:hypothetical protein
MKYVLFYLLSAMIFFVFFVISGDTVVVIGYYILWEVMRCIFRYWLDIRGG